MFYPLALVLLASVLSRADETTPHAANQQASCPGICQNEDSCLTVLNETDCADDTVCCIDNLERASTTEFADWDQTSIHYDPSSTSERFEETSTSTEWDTTTAHFDQTTASTDWDASVPTEEMEKASENENLNEIDGDIDQNIEYLGDMEDDYGSISDESGAEYTYLYNDEMRGSEGHSEDAELTERELCPGYCVLKETASACKYIYATEACGEDICCILDKRQVNEIDIENLGEEEDPLEAANSQISEYEYEAVPVGRDYGDSHVVSERAAPSYDTCPGVCVHPSQSIYCDQVLPQFPCPFNSRCCVKTVAERAIYGSQIVQCNGKCLPLNKRGFCFPPHEILNVPTNCGQGMVCCKARNPQELMQPPVNRMNFPGIPTRPSNTYTASHILGHLAVDDAGTVFKVSPDGHVSPLPKLRLSDHLGMTYNRLTSYRRADGVITIFADVNGKLYQQFFPFSPFQNSQSENPDGSQPIYQYDSQSSEQSSKAQSESKPADLLEDIVIPDEDEYPKTSAKPSTSIDSSSPACPGSCMSYFLRFTCFRGYALYDGFSCPGRSVCCAKLKDIEDHEELLKSLSPYFSTPSPSRDSNPPRCGQKGRRDTPRVVGGKDSLPGEWCWQVAVLNAQNQYICGGVLIDDSWVLTSAHCVAGSLKEDQSLFIRAGVTDLKSAEDNSKGQTARVLSTFIHHNFNNMNLDNNIALLRLKKPVDLGANVCVICLPTKGEMPEDDSKCTVTGYGFVSPDGDMSLRIREARVPIVDDLDCMSNITEALANPFILPSSSFCAGGEGHQDACQGDAGGALACEVGGFHEVIGLVSWGLGCGRSDVPSIYVKVPAFMGWINQIISSNSMLKTLH